VYKERKTCQITKFANFHEFFFTEKKDKDKEKKEEKVEKEEKDTATTTEKTIYPTANDILNCEVLK
jgi:hypothetical protein